MPSATPRESRIPKNARSGLIEIIGGAERYVLRAEQGNFNLSIPGATTALYLDRGRIIDPDDPESEPMVLDDQDQPLTGSFSAYLMDMFSDDYLTLADFVLLYGKAALVPTDLRESGSDSPRLVTIQWWPKSVRHGDPKNKGVRCPYSKITGTVAEGSPNLITCNFTSYYPNPLPAVWER